MCHRLFDVKCLARFACLGVELLRVLISWSQSTLPALPISPPTPPLPHPPHFAPPERTRPRHIPALLSPSTLSYMSNLSQSPNNNIQNEGSPMRQISIPSPTCTRMHSQANPKHLLLLLYPSHRCSAHSPNRLLSPIPRNLSQPSHQRVHRLQTSSSTNIAYALTHRSLRSTSASTLQSCL